MMGSSREMELGRVKCGDGEGCEGAGEGFGGGIEGVDVDVVDDGGIDSRGVLVSRGEGGVDRGVGGFEEGLTGVAAW